MPQPGKHSGNVDKAFGLTKQGGSKNRRDENEAEGTGKADPFRPKNGFRIADQGKQSLQPNEKQGSADQNQQEEP